WPTPTKGSNSNPSRASARKRRRPARSSPRIRRIRSPTHPHRPAARTRFSPSAGPTRWSASSASWTMPRARSQPAASRPNPRTTRQRGLKGLSHPRLTDRRVRPAAIEAGRRLLLHPSLCPSPYRTKRAFALRNRVCARDRGSDRAWRDLDRVDAGQRLWRRYHRVVDRMAEERHVRDRPLCARDGRAHRRTAGRFGRRGRILCERRRCRPTAGPPLRRAVERDHSTSPLLDHHLVRPRRSTRGQFGAAARLHQPGNHPQRGRQLRHRGGPTRAAGQLAPNRRRGEVSAGSAALRYPDRHGGAHRIGGADAHDQQEGLPVIRLALWLLGALLLAGIVHLATVLLLPRMATQDAYARVSAIAPVNAVTPVPSPTPEKAVMPFMDPAFQVSVCRYDLSRGPLKFSVPISQAYTSVSFYTRSDIAYYAINDRAAGRRVIELDLMTA